MENNETPQAWVTTVTLVTGCPEDIYPNFGYINHDCDTAEQEIEDILISYDKDEYHIVSTPIYDKATLISKLHEELKDRGYTNGK